MKAAPPTTQFVDERHVFEYSKIILYGVFEHAYSCCVCPDTANVFATKEY